MNGKNTPCIIIPGVGQSKMEQTDEHGNVIKTAWPLHMDANVMIKKIIKPYLRSIPARKDKGFTDAIHDLFCEALLPLSMLPDGTMKYNVRSVLREYPASRFTDGEKRFLYRLAPVRDLAGVIGEENIYLFAFNFFTDLYESAEQLDRFISLVKEQTGSDKVCLVPVSMGGALVTAYFDAYGQKNDIAKVMYIEAALDGSVLMSDLFRLNVDKNNGYSVLEFATSKKVSDAMRVLLSLVPWEVRYGVLYKSLGAAFETAINYSPAMWQTVPTGDYEELRGKLLAGDEFAALREKTDRFMKAQKNIRNIFAERQAAGTKIYACSGYGMRIMALSASDTIQTDTVLSTASTSLGAACAPRGQKLPASALTKDSRLSPDGSVDASTGFFRDTTWYIKGQVHNDTCFNDTVQKLVCRVMTDENFKDVFSDPALPQFIEATDSRNQK